MKNTLRKTLSLLMTLTVLLSALPAAASEAYGEQLIAKERQLHEGAVLHNETYWSSYYSDLLGHRADHRLRRRQGAGAGRLPGGGRRQRRLL